MDISETDPRDVINIPEKVPQTLAERLERVEAKLQVMDLVAQYVTSEHTTSVESDYRARPFPFYTEDIEYVLGGTLDVRVKGKEALQRHFAGHRGFQRKRDGKPTWRGADSKFRHRLGLPVIRLSDDCKEAWVTCHFSGITTRFSSVHSRRVSHEGTFILTLVKQEEGWRIRKFVNNSELAHNPLFYVVEQEP